LNVQLCEARRLLGVSHADQRIPSALRVRRERPQAPRFSEDEPFSSGNLEADLELARGEPSVSVLQRDEASFKADT